MPGTKRVINIGSNADDGTGDLLRDAFNKVNQNFDDVWTYGAVNSNLNLTGDTINGTTDVIINPADTGAFKVTGDTIINSDNGNYNFTVNGDIASNVLYVQASTGRVGILNTSPTVAFDVTGDAKVSGTTTLNNLTVEGTTILGNANTDTIQYVGKINSDLLSSDSLKHIGATASRWGTVYATNLDVSGSISGTFTGNMTSTMTGDVNNTNVTTVNLTATGPSNLQNVNVSGNLVVQGTTTTLETNDVLVNNQITFEGTTADDHETILTVTEPTQDNTITFKNASGTVAFTNDVPTTINDLTDVDTSTTPPTNGQALVWNNGNLEWEPGTVGGSTTFESLTDTPANFTGHAGKVVKVNAGETALEFVTGGAGLNNIVEDTTPQLGGTLDANSQNIDMGTNVLTDANLGQFITAYGWGDHGSAGYLTSVPAQSFASLTGKPTTIAGYGITDAFDGAYGSLSGAPTMYANSDVDAHLNQSGPTSGYVLSWNGSDYAWVANSGTGLANIVDDTTPQLGGNLDAQAFNITTTGKILYANMYANLADLPNATTYHGMFAHVHATGKGYFAHGGAWIPLQNESALTGDVDTHLNTSTATSGQVLSWDGSDYDWVANSGSGATSINTAGNTGTGSVTFASETLTVTGTTGQINVDAASFALSFSLDTNLTGLTTINTHTIPGGTGTLALTSGVPTSLSDLSDILVNSPTNTQQLVYNTSNARFENVDPYKYITIEGSYGAGGGASNGTVGAVNDISGTNWQTNYFVFNPTTASKSNASYGGTRVYGGVSSSYEGPSSGEREFTFGLTSLDVEAPDITSTFNVGNNGASDYTFSDTFNHWFPTTENDPVLYLRRGEAYKFVVNASGHPFEIRTGSGGSAYNTGVTNNTTDSGTITFKVPMSAPATLYYQCTSHSGMGNTINIV